MKTSDLTGAALDWAVAKCEGWDSYISDRDGLGYTCYSTNWAQGGPIIERERLYIQPGPVWYAMRSDVNQPMLTRHSGPTPLIAAMRVFVASRLGNEVDVPEELAALVKGE